MASPVVTYGSEKRIDFLLSSVAVIDEIIKSMLPVLSAVIKASNLIFLISKGLPK